MTTMRRQRQILQRIATIASIFLLPLALEALASPIRPPQRFSTALSVSTTVSSFRHTVAKRHLQSGQTANFTCIVQPDASRKLPVASKQKARSRRRIKSLFKTAKDLERKGQWRQASSLLREILEMDPKDAHSHLALARLEARREQRTNHTDARKVFSRGTEKCPNSIHLWQAWAVYEESQGSYDRARELFEKSIQLDHKNPYVCHAFGLMEQKLGNVAHARELWLQALKHKSTAALVCSLGQEMIQQGQLTEARELYKQHVMRITSARERTEVYLASAWLEERYFCNFDRAVQLINLALKVNPRSSVAQVALARLEGRRHSNGSGNEAVKNRLADACSGSQMQKDRPNDGRLFTAWANIEVKSRRLLSARNILAKGMCLYPKDYSLFQAAGKVEERAGNYTGARELYSASLTIEPSAPALVAYAMLELHHPDTQAVDFSKVEKLFEEALLVDPRHGPAYNAYGNAELRKGNVEKARQIFERGVRSRCSDAASLYHGYAKLELSLGNVDTARELLIRGREVAQLHDVGMDSQHRERARFLSHTLGMLELNSNRPADAFAVFQDGISRYGNSSQLLLGAALCEVKLGKEDAARSLFEQAVLCDNKHAQAWQAWGVMEMRAGNLKAAKTLFECGLKSVPWHGALWHAFATMEGRMGDADQARAIFRKGIKKAPRHVPLYQSWASMELREGNFKKAKELITEALTLDKRNGPGWLIAARIEESLGNTGLVSLFLRRGIECSPTAVELYRALGEDLVRRAKFDDAREVYEKGIEVNPLHAPLYHSLAELEALVFNVEGLARLNKRIKKVFNSNALEPPPSSSKAWGSKIRAERSRDVPKGIAALAEKIVVEEDVSNKNAEELGSPGSSMTADQMEDDLVAELLGIGSLPENYTHS